MKRFFSPSKTFVVGEYAVLEGAPALLLGHAPFFEARFQPGASKRPDFHPESPAGRLFAARPAQGAISLSDPHAGKGGFGASGAEFLSVFAAGRSLPVNDKERAAFAWSAWDAYQGNPGSGADILTQAHGVNDEEFFLRVEPRTRSLEAIKPGGLGLTLSLFRTGKKLDTHRNLASPKLPEAAELVNQATESLKAGNASAFAKAVGAYGAELAKLGLLSPHSARALQALPPVPAAKGCGAMGADVLLVLHENGDLASWARENSLVEALRLSV